MVKLFFICTFARVMGIETKDIHISDYNYELADEALWTLKRKIYT